MSEVREVPEKQVMFVSFSGGRTSAYMCWWLLNNKADEYDFKFVFANTGLEHEKTLEFVDRCDKEFGLRLTWVEALVDPREGKGIRHKIVTYETASRNGEPFEDFIRKSGIPNSSYNQCSERLKTFPMESYRKSLGFKRNHLTAIGIRSDEIDRMSERAEDLGLCYPLITMTYATKAQIRHWWSGQQFDLDLPEHLGNCVTCWKKSDRKLLTIAKHEPERFEFMDRMEKQYRRVKAGDEDRVFFRHHRTTQDILTDAQAPFVEFQDYMPELQLGFFDEMDFEDGCGSRCEIQ